MRNIKKLLALVLVLVMAMSFASATYADADSITNDEAVAVMSGVGIFNGIDGEFQPTGTLTREQAAKIIAYMLLGQKVADTLPNDTQPFTDVEAGRWSSGSIAYCASLGIISGRGNGSFDPTAKVTGYEFGKMVMVAVGINGTFTGSGYEFAVATALASNKLMTGLEGVILNQPLTREKACQLAFNGLLYAATERENGNYVISYTGSDEVLAAVVAGMQFGSYLDAIVAANALELDKAEYAIVKATVKGNDLHDFTQFTEANDFGVVTTGWCSNNGKTTYYSVEETPVYTVADKTISAADLHTLLGLKAKAELEIPVYANSKTANDSIVAVEKGTDTVGGTGVTTSVYFDGVNVKIVEVTSTLTKVTEAHEAEKASEANPKGVPAYVELANGLTIETESYEKGDVLIVTVAEGAVQTHELAEAVVGTVSRYNAASVTINGTSYKWAASAETKAVASDAWKTAYVYYTDGVNLYAYAEVEEAVAEVVVDGYAYVTYWQVAYETKAGTSADLFNEATAGTSSAAAKAVLINLDGSTEYVDLAVAYDAKAKTYSVYNPAGELVTITASTDGAEYVGAWAAYQIIDGEYSFLPVSGATVEDITVSKAAALSDGRLLTSKTTYTNINIHEKNQKVSTYTGWKNIVVDGEALVFTNEKTGVITSIYAVTVDAPEATVTTANYAYAVQAGDQVATGTEWTFFVDGKVVTGVVVTVDVTAGCVYDLTYTDGVVTDAKLVAAIDADEAVKVTLVDEDYFVAGAMYGYAKNIAVYNLKTGSVDTIDEGDKIVVAVASEGAAVLVYVVG